MIRVSLLLLLPLALLPSLAWAGGATELCNEIDDDGDGFIDEGYDLDNDGAYDEAACVGTSYPLDCNDSRPDVHPDATETCDGVDEDCDGVLDEDFDADGDGFVDRFDASCLDAWPILDTDCDDADPARNPGATELCDLIDNDCDGIADEGFDGDSDGFRVNSAACQDAYGADGVDCDDTNADIYPTAPELCDGLDNDCDGQIPEDRDDDEWFDAALCGDALDCDDDDPEIHPGADEVPGNGVDEDCDGLDGQVADEPAGFDCDGGTDRATVVFGSLPLALLGGIGRRRRAER